MTDCTHDNVEHDQRQVDVDRFVSENTGRCEDCGRRVQFWSEEDPDGITWGYEEIEAI